MARYLERVCATSEAAALARKHRNCSRLRRFRWVLACALLLVAAAGAPDPSSLPVNADRRFELSPGTESVLGDPGLIAFDAETLGSTEASGHGGDSRPDSDASLTFPHSVAAAATGSVYVAENGNRGIFKSTPVSLVSPDQLSEQLLPYQLEDKLMQHSGEQYDSQQLRHTAEMDDGYPSGKLWGDKRGLVTAGKMPCFAAKQVSEEGRSEQLDLSPVPGAWLRKLAARSSRNLMPGTAVRGDRITRFRGAGRNGCEFGPIITGSGFVKDLCSCDFPSDWAFTFSGMPEHADGLPHARGPAS